MNRRGKRLTPGGMAVGLVVVLVVAIANWGTVRDHVEAWYFQLTRETRTIEPNPEEPPLVSGWRNWFEPIANHLDIPIIIEAAVWEETAGVAEDAEVEEGPMSDAKRALLEAKTTTAAQTRLQTLRERGFRILEQRFPCRAYVVTGYPTP